MEELNSLSVWVMEYLCKNVPTKGVKEWIRDGISSVSFTYYNKILYAILVNKNILQIF